MPNADLTFLRKVGLALGFLITVSFVLGLLPLLVITWIAFSLFLRLVIAVVWVPRGVRYLVVYSDSAQWKDYFEFEVLPALGPAARSINLSTDGGKKRWWELDWRVYQHAGGYRNRFPIIFRFSRFGGLQDVRFYEAFMMTKKGSSAELQKSKAVLEFWIGEDRSQGASPARSS